MSSTTQELNQNDVLGDTLDDDQGIFNRPPSDDAQPKVKEKKKEILGLSLGLWALLIGTGIFVVFILGRTFMGRGGSEGSDQGEFQAASGSPMSLEAAEAEEQTPPRAELANDPLQAPSAGFIAQPGSSQKDDQPAPPVLQTAAQLPEAADLAPGIAAGPVAPAKSGPADVGQEVQPHTAASVSTQQHVTAAAPVASAVDIEELQNRVSALETRLAALGPQNTSASRAARAAPAASRRAPVARGDRETTSRPRAQQNGQGAPASAPVTGVTLRAVVADSAWVQTSTGESVQVRTGDMIPGIGTVKGVHPETGSVSLADGRVIK